MANTKSGNTWYIDSTGTLEHTGVLVVDYIVLSPSTHGSGNPALVLKDRTNAGLLKIKVCTSNTQSTVLDFTKTPIQFFDGINASTVTDAVATIIYRGGPG